MNKENFERALKKNKIIKYHKLFESVLKDYLDYEKCCKFYIAGNDSTGICDNCNQPLGKHKFN
jgi:hypothetical protein